MAKAVTVFVLVVIGLVVVVKVVEVVVKIVNDNGCYSSGSQCSGISKSSNISSSSSSSIIAVNVVAVAVVVVETKNDKTNFMDLYLSTPLVIIHFIYFTFVHSLIEDFFMPSFTLSLNLSSLISLKSPLFFTII